MNIFFRIHYPLPLPYCGKVDPTVLQETICELRKQIKHLRKVSATDIII